jgi:hypothetical protein
VAKLCYAGRVMMENRNALVVAAAATLAPARPSGRRSAIPCHRLSDA